MSPRCCRCGKLASTRMAYDYSARHIWLIDAGGESALGSYALCELHADRVTPPVTWTLSDRRRTAPPLPFARDVA